MFLSHKTVFTETPDREMLVFEARSLRFSNLVSSARSIWPRVLELFLREKLG